MKGARCVRCQGPEPVAPNVTTAFKYFIDVYVSPALAASQCTESNAYRS